MLKVKLCYGAKFFCKTHALFVTSHRMFYCKSSLCMLDYMSWYSEIQTWNSVADYKCGFQMHFDYENRFQMQIICGLQVWNTNVDFQCRFQKLIIKVNFKCGFQMLKRFSYVSFQFMCFCLWGITKLNTSINWSCRLIFVTIYRGSAADYFGICC